MKLFSVLVLYKGDPKPHIMKGAFDLASFSFFQRGTVQEMLCFTAKTLTERTQIGERQSVKEAEYMIHVFVRSDSLVGVCLSDHEYPHRVAHTMLTKVMEDFTNQVPISSISSIFAFYPKYFHRLIKGQQYLTKC